MARKYAISSREEATAYLDHPVLGQRLRECATLVTAITGQSIEDIFGYPDDLKFHSSMSLFAEAALTIRFSAHACKNISAENPTQTPLPGYHGPSRDKES